MLSVRHDARTVGALRLWCIGVVAATCLMVAPSAAHGARAVQGFSITPMVQDFDISPGARITKTITVTSAIVGSTKFTVGTEDVAGSTDAGEGIVLLGEQVDTAISGANWLTPNVTSFSLRSGESQTVSVVVEAPSGSSGGHYAAVTIAAESSTVGDGSVVAQSRAASLFLMNAGNAAPPPVVISETTTTVDGDIIVEYVDNGTVDVQPEATITYVDPVTGRVQRVSRSAVQCTRALPNGAGRCVIDGTAFIDKGSGVLTRGKVSLTNDGRTVTAEMPIAWAGTWKSALLPGIGIMLIVVFIIRRRRRPEDPSVFELEEI